MNFKYRKKLLYNITVTSVECEYIHAEIETNRFPGFPFFKLNHPWRGRGVVAAKTAIADFVEDDKMPTRNLNPPPNVLLEVLLTTTDPTRTKNHNVVTL
jgi:hypothetical protein